MEKQPFCIRTEDVAPRPWRNGGGVTRELFVAPAAEQWRVRLSVADIDRDGPFSSFPGVDRWFAVLEGAGVVLGIDGRAHEVRHGDKPLRFPGDAQVQCRLIDGPTRDLNLMLQGVSGGMCRAFEGESWEPPARHACGLYALVAGHCEAAGESRAWPAPKGDEESRAWPAPTVGGHTLLWFASAPPMLRFVAAGAAGRACGFWLYAGASA